MATTIKISALPTAVGIDASNDYLPIVQSGVTNKINRTTLLGITGNPLGTNDTQTIDNKTFNATNIFFPLDSNFTIIDATGLKHAKFSVANIANSTTRTFSLPDISDTVATLTATQTLTNKTLTAPTITSPSITGTVGGSATYSTPTLTQPTIGDFTNATHNHSNAAGGGSTLTSPTINTAIISNPTIRAWDGWEDANETWTFNSATAITVPSDATTKYQVGDKIKLTQSATVKYFYITAVSSTLLTINGGSDYTLTNVAISSNFYSHAASPLNFPQTFNYTTTVTGINTITVNVAQFSLNGRTCTMYIRQNGTSTATGFSVTAPILASTVTNQFWYGAISAVDNSSSLTTPARAELPSASTTVTLGKDWTGASWTNSGTRLAAFTLVYQI